MAFRKAERSKAKLRLGLVGTAGSGKTFSSLQIAFGLADEQERLTGQRPIIALVDTENGSGELYSAEGEYLIDQILPPFTPSKYIAKIKEAEKERVGILILDSISHAWAGEGGALDIKDKIESSSGKYNSYTAWREVTPLHNALINAMLQSSCHIIATMRAKTEYVLEDNEKGKKQPKKVGLSPVQRDGMDYEFTVVLDIDQQKHYAKASKDRTKIFADGIPFVPSRETGKALHEWLESGAEPTPAAAVKGKPSAAKLEFFRRYKEYGEDPKDKGALTAFVLDFVGKDPFVEHLDDDDYKKLIREMAKLEKAEVEARRAEENAAGQVGESTDDNEDEIPL